MADILASGHSRVPVFAGERRNVLGLLLVKRLMPVSPGDGRRVGEFVFRTVFVDTTNKLHLGLIVKIPVPLHCLNVIHC